MDLYQDLRSLFDDSIVTIEHSELIKYGQDETEDFVFEPDVVVKPKTVEQLSQLMAYCNKVKIPVTPRGAGTGLSGASLPIHKGVLLSMEHFNSIIEIDNYLEILKTEISLSTKLIKKNTLSKSISKDLLKLRSGEWKKKNL